MDGVFFLLFMAAGVAVSAWVVRGMWKDAGYCLVIAIIALVAALTR